MTCKEVNERLVCWSLLVADHSGHSYGVGTFQETLEFSKLGGVVKLPEILRLLCQILTRH